MVKENPKRNLGKNNNEKAKGSEIGFFFCARKDATKKDVVRFS